MNMLSEQSEKLKIIDKNVDLGLFVEAESLSKEVLDYLTVNDDGSARFLWHFLSLAGKLIDIGHHTNKLEITKSGLEILIKFEAQIQTIVPMHGYFYNLANAYSDLAREKKDTETTFAEIQSLVTAKNYYWKALKEARTIGDVFPELYVNLGNCLKRQYRISESIHYYKEALSIDQNIAQAHVNKSETLFLLNEISDSFSAKMLSDIVDGYKAASQCGGIPPNYAEFYAKKSEHLVSHFEQQGISLCDEGDEAETNKEFLSLLPPASNRAYSSR